MPQTKEFDLADVLTVTTGIMLSDKGIDSVYSILNHMTGESLLFSHLSYARTCCLPLLFSTFPSLEAESPPETGEINQREYLKSAVTRLGNSFHLPTLSSYSSPESK